MTAAEKQRVIGILIRAAANMRAGRGGFVAACLTYGASDVEWRAAVTAWELALCTCPVRECPGLCVTRAEDAANELGLAARREARGGRP